MNLDMNLLHSSLFRYKEFTDVWTPQKKVNIQ